MMCETKKSETTTNIIPEVHVNTGINAIVATTLLGQKPV